MKWLLATAVAALGLVFAAAPYWVGSQLEQIATAAQAAPALRVEFERGWFRSHARSQFTLHQVPSGPLPPVRISLQHRLGHGLLPLDGLPQPGLASMRTELAPDNDWQSEWISLNRPVQPLVIDSWFAIGGSQHHRLNLASAFWSVPERGLEQLHSNGAEAALAMDSDNRLSTAELELRDLTMRWLAAAAHSVPISDRDRRTGDISRSAQAGVGIDQPPRATRNCPGLQRICGR